MLDKNLEEQLTACQNSGDWAGLARTYYELGVAAMEEGDLYKSVLWLNRADTIFSASDDTYDAVGEELIDDCSDRLAALEDTPLLYNQVVNWIADCASGDMPQIRLRIWALLSLARLVQLGKRLSVLPGCAALGELGWAVDFVFHSLQEPPSQQDFERMVNLCDRLVDELEDNPNFYGSGSQIEVPGGKPFQLFDLNGMLVLLDINAFLHSQLALILSLLQEDSEEPGMEIDIIACALLLDYYSRTCEDPEEAPQVKAELKRLEEDYSFICEALSWEKIDQRLKQYKELDILAPVGQAPRTCM